MVASSYTTRAQSIITVRMLVQKLLPHLPIFAGVAFVTIIITRGAQKFW